MKSKRLIAILSVLIFLIVLIVINSTLFTLQKVSVNWLTSKYQLNSIKDYELVENIEMGQSIFLIQKDEIVSKLEKENPYLRVVGVETKFPNKLVIHSAERESLYAIKLSDNEYAIIDELGKVLELNSSRIFEGSGADLGTRPIMLTVENLSLKEEDFQVGETIKLGYVETLISGFSKSLKEAGYSPTTSKGVIKHIDIVSLTDTSKMNIQTRNGMVISISDMQQHTTDKLLLGFELYNTLHNDGVVDCTIEVWHNDNTGKIFADVDW